MDIIAQLGFWGRLIDGFKGACERNDYLWFLRIGGGTSSW